MKKAAIWTACVIVAGAVAFAGLRGCTTMPWNKRTATAGCVSISVTRDYGRGVVREGDVNPSRGASVMEALKSFAKVETQYGGGFVSSIDGVATQGGSARKDWFYYLNGVMPEVGADEVRLEEGDIVWWDYHPWLGTDYATAVVGSYPAPFTKYRESETPRGVLFYGDGMGAAAREVGAFLEKSGAKIRYAGIAAGEGLTRVKGPSMVFLTCAQAAGTPEVGGLLTSTRGAFVTLAGETLVPLDSRGEPGATGSDITCAVASTASGMGDPSPVWFVLCRSAGDAGQAMSLLTTGRDSLRNRAGVTVDASGRIERVPR